MKGILQLLYNLLLCFDQVLNTFLLGHPDETLSSRLGRSIGKERYFWVKWVRLGIDALFFFDKGKKYVNEDTYIIIGHCEKSVMPLEQQNFREVVDYEIWSWSK